MDSTAREPDPGAGAEPDPRFTFANERTFLAWTRTSLALIGGGLIAAQALEFELGATLIAVLAIGLGGVLAIRSYSRWLGNERALRHGAPLDESPLVRTLTVGVAILAAVSTVVIAVAAVLQ